MSSTMVTRIAPSPTGPLHVGTARTALFNYLFAKKMKGKFLLRIEDTDKARNKPEFEKDIINQLLWLGLENDGISLQSEHVELHQRTLRTLLESGHAYLSKEPKKDDPSIEIEVVRLRNPGERVVFTDMIRGEVTFDTTELGDFVIARSIDKPLYHLAAVVDDHDMGVTHVLRGEDHVSNTPRQILIQQALGYGRPVYAHLPLILGSDRAKLSKRHGSVSIAEYKAFGYLPEALINYLALLGWNPDSNREIFSLEELINEFDIEEVHKAGAVFDVEKLNWFNREYIACYGTAQFLDEVLKYIPKKIKELPQFSKDRMKLLVPILKERIYLFSEVEEMAKSGELAYFFAAPVIEIPLAWKNDTSGVAKKHLEALREIVELVPATDFTREKLEKSINEYAAKEGRGSVLWPLRVALSGREKSPGPYEIAEVLGKEETVARLKSASATL